MKIDFQPGKFARSIIEKAFLLFDWFRERLKNPAARGRFIFLIILFSLAFTGLIFFRNVGALRQQELHLNFLNLAFSLLAFPLGFIPSTVVWHNLLQLLNIRLPYPLNLKYYCLSAMPRHIPGFVAYFASRSLLYEEQKIDGKRIMVASTLEIFILSLIGFVLAFVIFAVSSLSGFYTQTAPILSAAFVLVLLVMILFFVFFRKRLFQGENSLSNIFAQKKLQLAVTIFWTLISWAGGGVFLFFVINTITPLGWGALPLVIGIWSASGAMSMALDPFTSGIGIRMLSLGGMLSILIPPVASIVVAVGINVVFIIAEIVWIGILMLMTKQLLRGLALEK